MNLEFKTIDLHYVDARMLSVLLTSCGASPAYIETFLINRKVNVFLSGSVPTTIFLLGVVQFPFASEDHQWPFPEVRFAVNGTVVQYLLMRYPNGECHVEVLVNGNSLPWCPTKLPNQFEVLFGNE